MKKIICTATTIFVVSCAPTKTITKIEDNVVERNYNTNIFTGPKKKLAIAQFKNSTRFSQRRLGENISAILATELNKSNRFLLLEREQVDKLFEQMKLSQTGATVGSLDQIQLLDADFLITGEITQYSVTTTGSSDLFSKSKIQNAQVAADIRIMDTRTGEIILSETGRGQAEKNIAKYSVWGLKVVMMNP